MTSSGQPKVETSPGIPQVNPLPAAGWIDILCWAFGRRSRIRVSGSSMLPLLKNDDEVLVAPSAKLIPGDIVVAQHPFRTNVLLIKYLAGYDEDGRVCLRGLNPAESTDSRTLGNLNLSQMVGKVTCRISV